MMNRLILGGLGLGFFLGAAWALLPAPAEACGGFFCQQGTGPTPVVQAGERVIFEQRADGKVRAYVQIRYQQPGGPPIGFSWIVPVMNVPEVGIAEEATFDALDRMTAPQFRFLFPTGATSSGGGGGCGLADSDSAFAPRAGGGDATAEMAGVMVWEEMRVGDYETATIGGEDAALLLAWLQENEFDIPDEAEDIIGDYVDEGHVFVAFRYAPIGEGTGTLAPITLTMEADKPCVPIRITAIASTPILDVIVTALGPRRASPWGEYTEAMPDYQAIRTDFSLPTNTTYTEEVDRAVGRAGDHAWVVEYAGDTDSLLDAMDSATAPVMDPEARALLSRNAYLTRFYTRFRPDTMTIDPEFVFDGGEDVNNLHVIDLRGDDFAANETSRSDLRFALFPGALLGAAGLLYWRRRQRV